MGTVDAEGFVELLFSVILMFFLFCSVMGFLKLWFFPQICAVILFLESGVALIARNAVPKKTPICPPEVDELWHQMKAPRK